MHPRWVALLGGLGALDVAYIDFVLGPRCFAAAAPAFAPTTESAASAPPALEPLALEPLALEPLALEPPALGMQQAAVAHERPPGETWWIVNFPEAGASLNPAAEQQLQQIAQRVGDSHDVRMNIIGHADARGSDDYNRKLGQRRARAIADALLHAGFRPEQIVITSRGEASPAVLGASRDAWASNRRVEIEIEAIPRSDPTRSESP